MLIYGFTRTQVPTLLPRLGLSMEVISAPLALLWREAYFIYGDSKALQIHAKEIPRCIQISYGCRRVPEFARHDSRYERDELFEHVVVTQSNRQEKMKIISVEVCVNP